MLVWNKKGGCLKGKKRYFFYGNEIPDNELSPERVKQLIAIGSISEISKPVVNKSYENSELKDKKIVESKGKKGKDK